MKHLYSTDRALSRRLDAHHIDYVWHVRITALDATVGRLPEPFFSSAAEEVCRRYMTMSLQSPLSLPLSLECLDSTTQLTLLDRPDLRILRMTVTISHSGLYPLSDPTLARRSMLALPNQIDFADATATIRRTLVLTSCAWNSSLGVDWLELPPRTSRTQKVHHTLRLNWAEHGPLSTLNGSPATTPTSEC